MDRTVMLMRALLAALILCTSIGVAPAAPERCTASVYWIGEASQPGTATASGIPLDDAKPTVAHKTRPLRTHIRVENIETGLARWLMVTDRGPYIAGRCVDLSRAAAILLGCKGLCPVKVEP